MAAITAPTAPTAEEDPTRRTVAVINRKGGVRKTSIVANVGGMPALAGYQVSTPPSPGLTRADARSGGYGDRSRRGHSGRGAGVERVRPRFGAHPALLTLESSTAITVIIVGKKSGGVK